MKRRSLHSLLFVINCISKWFLSQKFSPKKMCLLSKTTAGADPGEVKRVNFHPPFSEPPSFFLFFLIPQLLIGSNTLLQKFTPHFKILDPRLHGLKQSRETYYVKYRTCTTKEPCFSFMLFCMFWSKREVKQYPQSTQEAKGTNICLSSQLVFFSFAFFDSVIYISIPS